MKKRYKVIIIILAFLVLLVAGWKFYDGFYFRQNKKIVQLKCNYVMYACGECYPRWNIDSTFATQKGFNELIGKDFYVFFKGKEVEESLPDSIDKCMQCYDYYFTGILKKTLNDKFKFEADTFKIKIENPDCCNQMKE